MSDDEMIEAIRTICAPLTECRALRDRIIAELERRFVASKDSFSAGDFK